MKKINMLFATVLSAAAVVSCTEKMIEAPESPAAMTIFATAEQPTKTILDGAKLSKVVFTSADRLFVYGDNAGTISGVQFTAKSLGRKPSYLFSTTTWEAGTPIYAVNTTDKSADNVCTAAGAITLRVNNQNQVLDWEGSYAGNSTTLVGAVTEDAGAYNVEGMKNVCSLIGFSIRDNSIKKIVVTGNGGEALGGWVTADYAKMGVDEDFYTPVTGKTYDALNVTVAATVNGNEAKVTNGIIPKDTAFFISILPGTYSGLTFTLIDSLDRSATRNIATSIQLKRAECRFLKHPLDSGLIFKDPEMPDTLTFNIGYGQNWPFDETAAAKADQKSTGETYNYSYTDSESGYTGKFPFVICNYTGLSAKGYAWNTSSKSLDLYNEGDWIKLPAIEGRRVVSISLKVRNAKGKSMSIGTTAGTGEDIVSTQTIKDTVFAINGSLNTSYYINARNSSCFVSGINVVYAPAGNIVLDCTDATKFRYDNGGTPTAFPTTSHGTSFVSGDFWLLGNEAYIFNGAVKSWNKTLNAAKDSPVKLPAISGYKLTKVTLNGVHKTGNCTYRLTDGTNILAEKTINNSDSSTYGDMSIDFSKAASDDRYLVCAVEMSIRFTLTYSPVK